MGVRKQISYVITTLLIGVFVWYFTTNLEQFAILLSVPWWAIMGVAGGTFAAIVINGFFIRKIVSTYGIDIHVKDAINASFISSVGNFFFTAGVGSIAQAKYLKNRYKFSYKNFVTFLSGSYILVFLVNGALGLLSLVILADSEYGLQGYVLGAVFFSMTAASLYLAIKGVPNGLTSLLDRHNTSRIATILKTITGGWNTLVNTPGLIGYLTILTVANFLMSMIIGYFSFLAIGVEAGIWALVLYAALGSVTLVLNLTPGSIGIREGVLFFAMSLIGLNIAQVLSISLIERGVRFFVMMIGLVVFSRFVKFGKDSKV